MGSNKGGRRNRCRHRCRRIRWESECREVKKKIPLARFACEGRGGDETLSKREKKPAICLVATWIGREGKDMVTVALATATVFTAPGGSSNHLRVTFTCGGGGGSETLSKHKKENHRRLAWRAREVALATHCRNVKEKSAIYKLVASWIGR